MARWFTAKEVIPSIESKINSSRMVHGFPDWAIDKATNTNLILSIVVV